MLSILNLNHINFKLCNNKARGKKKLNLLRFSHGIFELYFYILLGSWFPTAFWSNKIVTFPYLSEKQKYFLFKICVLIIFVLLHKRSTLCWTSFVPLLWDNLLQYWFISSVQSLSRVWLFATPWITVRQASLSITNSRSSLKLMSIG